MTALASRFSLLCAVINHGSRREARVKTNPSVLFKFYNNKRLYITGNISYVGYIHAQVATYIMKGTKVLTLGAGR